MILVVFFISLLWPSVTSDFGATIGNLSLRIQQAQVKRETESRPPFFWHKEKGLYESDVKLYFHGDYEMYNLRREFGIFDNNMFATAWITIGLLEAYRFGNAPKPSESQIKSAVEAINLYHDKNKNYANSLMTFWPQVYNRTLYAWQSTPQNLLDLFDLTYGVNWDKIYKLLQNLGLGELANVTKTLISEREMFRHSFVIPADFDDTFVNLGLGTILKEMSDEFPESYALWKKENSNITSILDALKKYAYRPMSKDQRINTIDPRTYFYIRGFLEQSASNGEDIALVPTWIQDTDEVRTLYYKGIDMPFNINNVDCTVAANVIYGLTNGLLSGLLKEDILDDPEIQILQDVRAMFGSVLKGRVTQLLTDSYKVEVDNRIYYDDFLGDADIDSQNNTQERGEDRIFTTAMAVNTLLTTWTVRDDGRKRLIWEHDTPLKVFETVRQGANWLDKYSASGRYKPWNSFFSGSVKGGLGSLPFVYPINRFEFLNGTKVNQTTHLPGAPTIIGVQGMESEQWYESELKKPHFGNIPPTEFHGYNNDKSFFPFWSSESYTNVVSLLALSKYNNAVQRSTTTANPPFSYYKDKGMYESDVKMYFHGDSEMHLLRESMSVFDNNMFATCWITIGLLESHRYGKAPKPSKKQMQLALEAISMYTDKNRNYANSVMNFWPQVYNRTAYAWQSTPQNLVAILKSTFGKNWGLIEKILEAFGQEMSDKFPEEYTQWAKTNSNLTSVLDALKKYAYRPMSNDTRVNTIDPRTYFHVRKFLENATLHKEDIALVSTWAQDLQEVRTAYDKGVAMPLNINNVDCTVAANTIYGITHGILSGLLNNSVLDDPDIKQIYRNTSNLIAFEIETSFTDHKDLALTYYPSEYEFYWFVARTYTQIQKVKDLFGQVLKGKVTKLLTESYKIEIDDRIYWDDFLGNGDKDSENRTVARGEDRIFTTAMAINTLLTIWTVHDDVRDRLIWEQDTPLKVFETVKQGVNWLDIQALGGEFKPWNAFFSGSLKGFVSSNPSCYPKNVYEYLNGTKINKNDKITSMAYTLGVQGVPSEEWYENEFKTPCYGQTVPKVFPGYNNDPSFWPFWTSEPYTYTISMLAMSKYRNAVIG
ncbi:hypothetical protein KUTeg_001655 [Tegillarca granosa]|uniref:Uncharacterized protein n=1 Tax=Tegillarca granosa TaxID=220873 RepID=A0ABQ9FWI4_TEGGR|nr:hypothetical protein KUTeg_001655 [Tegillarca granosa]